MSNQAGLLTLQQYNDGTGRLKVSGTFSSATNTLIAPVVLTMITGTPVAVGSASATKRLTIRADVANGAFVYVGLTGVTSATGYELTQGESLVLDIDDFATAVYVDGTTGDKVRVLVEV